MTDNQTTRDPYIKGHFTDRIRRGDVPMYGYTAPPMPKATGTMTVVTGYLMALRREAEDRANAKA